MNFSIVLGRKVNILKFIDEKKNLVNNKDQNSILQKNSNYYHKILGFYNRDETFF